MCHARVKNRAIFNRFETSAYFLLEHASLNPKKGSGSTAPVLAAVVDARAPVVRRDADAPSDAARVDESRRRAWDARDEHPSAARPVLCVVRATRRRRLAPVVARDEEEEATRCTDPRAV